MSGGASCAEEELIGEPRLAPRRHLSQPSLTTSLNTAALLNLQTNPAALSAATGPALWSNPLAAASLLQQQQEAVRKVMESANANGKLAAQRTAYYYLTCVCVNSRSILATSDPAYSLSGLSVRVL